MTGERQRRLANRILRLSVFIPEGIFNLPRALAINLGSNRLDSPIRSRGTYVDVDGLTISLRSRQRCCHDYQCVLANIVPDAPRLKVVFLLRREVEFQRGSDGQAGQEHGRKPHSDMFFSSRRRSL